MFTNTFARHTLSNANREFVIKQIRNGISKTSTTSKNDVIIKKQNKNLRKWMKINEHNNKRALSTLQAKLNPLIDDIALGSDKENREFNATLHEVIREFNAEGRTADALDITKAYERVINSEKKRTGLTVLTAYKQLESQKNLTEAKIRVANILGWSVEFYHALLDEQSSYIYQKYMKDIDFTQTTPEKIRDDLKDVKIIENRLYNFLQKNFSGKNCYIPILDLFNECTLKSSIGIAYMNIFNNNGTPNLDMFTMDKYKALVRYKTVLNSFILPVTLAMFLAGKFDQELHRQARTVLNEVGNFHCVRRDFLNVFGSAAHNVASDIRDGKCSWLAVVALQRCSPEQRAIMRDHYGKGDGESVELIKQLYQDLGLPRTYEIYEEESFKIARVHAHQISKGLPHNLFFQMVEKIYRREIDFTPS